METNNLSRFTELIKKYKYILLVVLIFSIIIFISTFLSETYRVDKCLKRMKLYNKFISINSELKNYK